MGYPAAPRVGDPITGIEAAEELPGITVFHAGTKRVDGKLVTGGGRVLSVTAVAPTLAEARSRAYEAAAREGFAGTDTESCVARFAPDVPVRRVDGDGRNIKITYGHDLEVAAAVLAGARPAPG